MKVYPVVNNINSTPHFSGRVKVDIKSVNKNLIEYEKNDFISNVFPSDLMGQSYKERVNSLMGKFCQDCSLISYASKLFNDNVSLVGYKLAAIIKKKDMLGEDTIIYKKTPKIFEGVEKDALVKTLDTLAYYIRDDKERLVKDDVVYDIDGRQFTASFIGNGMNSIVVKISDEKGNAVAMKSYIKPENMNSFGIFGELALYQEIGEDKINNIPELYLANPLSVKVEDKTKEITEVCDVDNLIYHDGYKGGWTIIELITPDKALKNIGVSLQKWLQNKNLVHLDLSVENYVGKYIVDLGGITTFDYTCTDKIGRLEIVG